MPQQQTGTSISGVGKDSQRTDLRGTPGRKGGLSQGKVQEFEQGQQAIENTQGQPPAQAVTENPVPQAPPGASSMPVPDAMSFAKKRLGGNLQGAGTAPTTAPKDFDRWLPMVRRLAVSPTSSGILQRAYVERLSKEMNRPLGGSGAIIRQRKFDDQLRDQ